MLLGQAELVRLIFSDFSRLGRLMIYRWMANAKGQGSLGGCLYGGGPG